MPNHRDRAINICIILLSITTVCYLTAFLMHRDCKYDALRVGKRCNLPIKSQTILKTLEENVVDAEELLGMEDEWLTFRARLRFSTKDNKVSVEIVRFHSTKKDTSDWRMDPASATTDDQWFTIKGRWVGKPLSFQFAQTDSKIINVPKMMTQEYEFESIQPKVNNKDEDKQIGGTAISHDVRATDEQAPKMAAQDATGEPALKGLLPQLIDSRNEDKQTVGTASSQDDHLTNVQDATKDHGDFPGEPVSKHSQQKHATRAMPFLVSSDVCPAMTESFNTSSNLKPSPQPTLIEEKAPASLNTNKFWRPSHAGGQATQPTCPLRKYMSKCPVFQEYNESITEQDISYQTHYAFETQESQKDSQQEHTTRVRQFINSSDVSPAMTESFNTSSNLKPSPQPTFIEEKAPVSLNTDKFWRPSHAGGQATQPICPLREYMPKCPLFQEYNESNAEQDASYQTTFSFETQEPQKQRSLEASMSENEASIDTSSLVRVQSLDVDCPWYFPTDVLVGTATVVTVTVTVATSYVIMARPHYFWA